MRPIKNAKKIDYNLIKVFDMVITEGNVTRAARKLDVTPAAISQALLRFLPYTRLSSVAWPLKQEKRTHAASRLLIYFLFFMLNSMR